MEHWIGGVLAVLAAVLVGVQIAIPALDREDRAERRQARREKRALEKEESQPDERQERIRGRAAYGAYITLIVGLCVCGGAEALLGVRLDTLLLLSICIPLSLDVYALACICQDAWFGPREKPGRQKGALLLALAALMAGLAGRELGWTCGTPLAVFGFLLLPVPAAAITWRFGLEDDDEEDEWEEET